MGGVDDEGVVGEGGEEGEFDRGGLVFVGGG